MTRRQLLAIIGAAPVLAKMPAPAPKPRVVTTVVGNLMTIDINGLPVGRSGQVLTCDGSGGIRWIDPTPEMWAQESVDPLRSLRDG